MKVSNYTARSLDPPAYFPRHLSNPKPSDLNRHPQPFLLHVYWRAALLLALILTLSTIGLLSLSAHSGALPNPFSVYQHIMPGHSRADAMNQGAQCTLSSGPEPGDSCILAPASGPFKTVKMVLLGGEITSLNFTTRANALLVGDLESIWGKPETRPTARDGVVLLRWPEFHISATAHKEGSDPYSVLFLSVNLILVNQ